ncbi:MAG TPA: hypothetical protein VEI24_01415, partial [Nitrospiria bacterium]|nr:hypothetical protein [Nitrospiria bacterium]
MIPFPAASEDAATRRRAWVALAATAGLTPRGCAALLARYCAPEAILAAPAAALSSAPGVSRPAVEA